MNVINRTSGRNDAPQDQGPAQSAVTGRRILRIDASMRFSGSNSRKLADTLIDRLTDRDPGTTVVHRDLAVSDLPLVSEALIGAYFTKPDNRTADQKALLVPSDTLVAELKAADTIVFGVPVYNFGVPAALKAWVDLIARAGETFRYTENGPIGLLEGKKAYVILASGGTKAFSEIDFAGPYMRHILGFIGITDVEFVSADALMADLEGKLQEAKARIDTLAAQAA